MVDRERDWEDELRQWASRAPRLPGSVAAARVVARIETSQAGGRGLRWMASAAGVAALVCLGFWMIGNPGSRRPAEDVVPVPLPENVVQWWLDSETPVYFVTGPRGAERGGER